MKCFGIALAAVSEVEIVAGYDMNRCQPVDDVSGYEFSSLELSKGAIETQHDQEVRTQRPR